MVVITAKTNVILAFRITIPTKPIDTLQQSNNRGKDGHTARDSPNKSSDKSKEKEAPKTKTVKKIQTYQSKSKGKPSLEEYGVIEEDSSEAED